jgi:hypothetical protein
MFNGKVYADVRVMENICYITAILPQRREH